jgi:hypothetical protein
MSDNVEQNNDPIFCFTEFELNEGLRKKVDAFVAEQVEIERNRLIQHVLDNGDATDEQKANFLESIGWEGYLPNFECEIKIKVSIPFNQKLTVPNVVLDSTDAVKEKSVEFSTYEVLAASREFVKTVFDSEDVDISITSDHYDQIENGYDFYKGGIYAPKEEF